MRSPFSTSSFASANRLFAAARLLDSSLSLRRSLVVSRCAIFASSPSTSARRSSALRCIDRWYSAVSISASTNRARSPKHCANCLKYCGPRNSKCRRSAVCCSIRAKVSSSSTPISRTCTPIDLARLMLHCVRFEYDLSSSLSSPIPVMSLANRQRTVDV